MAVSNERILGFVGHRQQIIHVMMDDSRLSQMDFTATERKGQKTLSIRFESSLFHDNWKGEIEYRYHTDMAQELCDRIHENMAQATSKDAQGKATVVGDGF